MKPITLSYIDMINNFEEPKSLFIWNQLSWNVKDTLNDVDVAIQCPVSAFYSVISTQEANKQSILKQTKMISLQLRNNFVVLYDHQKQQIVDFFNCSFNVHFLVRNSVNSQLFSKNKQDYLQNNDSYIQFGSFALQTQILCFVIDSNHNKALEQFGIQLGKKLIVQRDFHQKFKPIRKIGKGLTSDVYKALRHSDSAEIAIKAFKKSITFQKFTGRGKMAFIQEVKILTQCNHPNICRYEGVFETENSVYIIMENYSRSLSHLLASQKKIPRNIIIGLIEKLLQTITYLNANGIMHRDIKLQNIMLKMVQDTLCPVLIDFGMAEYFKNEDFIFQKCGTPGYAAPELFQKRSTNPEKCDIFSLGVVFHVLLFKKAVFTGTSAAEILNNNRNINLSVAPELDHQNETIKDLLLRMLQPQNLKRISAEQALSHPLFRSSISTPALSSCSTEFPITQNHQFYLGNQI